MELNSKKQIELLKFKNLISATLDYYIDNNIFIFEQKEYFNNLRNISEEYFNKGSLTKLKKFFNDLIEPFIEDKDYDFNLFLSKKTNIDINIFEVYEKRLKNIIKKGKITSDSQFYDIMNYINFLSQSKFVDNELINSLNNLVNSYEENK